MESFGAQINELLMLIDPSLQMQLVGSYRRGKPFSNDIDILITHKKEGKEAGVLEKILDVLSVRNMLKAVLLHSKPIANRGFRSFGDEFEKVILASINEYADFETRQLFYVPWKMHSLFDRLIWSLCHLANVIHIILRLSSCS